MAGWLNEGSSIDMYGQHEYGFLVAKGRRSVAWKTEVNIAIELEKLIMCFQAESNPHS
jgi:hypothetical protein